MSWLTIGTAAALASLVVLSGAAAARDTAVFIDGGKPLLVRTEGADWTQRDGYLECAGTGNTVFAGRTIGAGDFRVKATLRIVNVAGSAATFVIDGTSHFGFEGSSGTMFTSGPVFGHATQFVGPPRVREGRDFLFEVVRTGNELRFMIDGEGIHTVTYEGQQLGAIGFRPWRSTMQIISFAAFGETIDTPPPAPPSSMPQFYTIPTIDLAHETHRQVIVDREPGQYLGHPTTVLLEDNKTMICVYPKGHGRGAIVMKRSTDAGLTWSDRLPTPENWATSQEVPTIYRVVDPQGVKRLIMFSGLYPIRMAVSEDDGATWTPLEPIGDFGGIVTMATMVRLKDGSYATFFHDDGRFLRDAGKRNSFQVFKCISTDGGLTWGQPEVVTEHPAAHLCEPGAVRSPDGKQIALLLRENSRKYNAFVVFSDDEGKTWSEPRELPASLTGDRHTARYAPDGRLFISFRDRTHISPTWGDWVGWVGTYEDIVTGSEGQYRVRLMDNHKGADTTYPAVELLPDGTFVTTTYGHWTPGEEPYIASVRFTMEELDAKAAGLPEQVDVFVSGEDGYHTYRIPALLVSKEGTLLAFCEGRKTSASDHGDLDLVLKRSEDGGQTWSEQMIVYEEGGDAEITIGNPCPVVDQDTGTIWLPFCRDNDDVFITSSSDDGRTWSQPIEITSDVKKPGWSWYATGPGVGIQLKRGPHKGRLVIPCDHRETIDGKPVKVSNVFYSDDHGETWELGGSVKAHTDECQVVELTNGRLLINMRNYWGREGGDEAKGDMRAIAWSEDGGETWSDIEFDETLIEPVCQASFIRYTEGNNNRVLFSNPASKETRHHMTVRLSYDEGETWPIAAVLNSGPSAYSCLTALPDGDIGCLYEGGIKGRYERITFARCRLEWLTGGREKAAR
jgi:Neuraminidase (sialidase)